MALALPLLMAQKKPVENSSNSARSVLIEKARTLESRRRPDMAAQVWQQILLSEPNNPEALAGLARDYKLMGNADRATEMLNRLRRVNPNDPSIARIQSLSSTQSESEELRRAGELARQGRADESVSIYRQLYGDSPPESDVAMAYYQTLYATASGKTSAVAGMRGLVQRNPANSRFGVALGTMLTYDPRTRAEGIHILQAYPKDAEAQSALRQALMWNAANPATASQLRQYLKSHPEDAEVAASLKANERKLAQMNTGIARTSSERAAFAALNAHRADEAQSRFDALLRQDPNNGRILAGIGFLRMQQRNFADAINFFSQAEQNGYKPKSVESALEASRFWDVIGEATQAFNENRLDVASARYKAALIMNERSADALNGLAGVLMKQQQYKDAAGVYEQLIAVQPASQDAWRGLFLAYAGDKQFTTALATAARFPEKVKTALAKDPEYLRMLASVYQAQNRSADAERVLAQTLALPFPNNGTTLQADTKLQYAGILMQAQRYSQAIPLYTQVVVDNPQNVSAWMGLVSAYHELGQDAQALAEVKKVPSATYDSALADPGFLSMLGAIYQQSGQYETAQGMLERAAKIEIAAGGQPGISLQLQLAGIYLARNNRDQAIAMFQRVVTTNPERADAWKGLVGALLAAGRSADALSQVAAIPATVRTQLDNDVEFEQSLASIYANTGDTARAVGWMNRVQVFYASRKMQPPANIEVQNAWLQYNSEDDRALYATLMRLGSRTDLTAVQRQAIQNIWATWSVRRAADAMDSGNSERAVDILDAALETFPDNIAVRKAVAGGYARVGRARDALNIFKALPMQDAIAGDYEGAIGAALAANDKAQAEAWLQTALDRFSNDPGILSLAARYEQARGDNQRAAAYWRAALAAMPPSTPTDKLAHELANPGQDANAHRPASGVDLKQLLDPDRDPSPKSTRPPADEVRPMIRSIPWAGPTDPQLFHQQSANGRSGTWLMHDGVYHPRAGSTLRHAYGSMGTTASPRMLRASLGQTQAAALDTGSVPIVSNPPHSIATEAWKGLINSLMIGNRNTEALAELARIPPDERRLLESDIEFVQEVANIYFAVNDSEQASAYLSRIESFYAEKNSVASAGLEIQYAWLLYNGKNEAVLYPVMLHLDERPDMTAEQHQQVSSIWAYWSLRRARAAMDDGNMQRGVEILEAAVQVYADNVSVRGALAGAYAKIGRSSDALALFKTIPLENAAAGDLEGAIGAALGAKDMAQAEVWLKQALMRFPTNPRILAMAARFEQARGNKERAAEYWRSALEAMPAGSSIGSLEISSVDSTAAHRASVPGELRKLLDPRNASQHASSGTMGDQAARAPTLIAAETDSQLTQGSAAVVHALSNAKVNNADDQSAVVQALTGQSTVHPALPPEKPSESTAAKARRAATSPSRQTTHPAPSQTETTESAAPPLSSAPAAPISSTADAQQSAPAPAEQSQPATSGGGVTGQQPEQRKLPPLRGPWPHGRGQRSISPREEAELQLRSIESGYSGWLAGTGFIHYRSGTLGYDHLTALEAPFEASLPMGPLARLTIVAKPVFLDSGQADGTSMISVLKSTASGTALATIPEPIGTLANSNVAPPAQQNATGVGGEVQLAFPQFAIAGGYAPHGFLVSTFTGRMMWRPANGPITVTAARDSQKDSQLSYAGLRDAGVNTLATVGQIWGGVVANQVNLQYAHSDAQSGFYFNVGGQYLTGYNVVKNQRIDGNGGAYWRMKRFPDYGDLNIGVNFFGMHYAKNENAFTHGMGGYFSPQGYFLANVPLTFTGHYNANLHYNLAGGLGVQAFQENKTKLWPLAVDQGLQASQGNPMLPDFTSVGANYDFRGQLAYLISPHWFAGGFFSANNTRNYSAASVGFSIHYMFRAQPAAASGPTGLFPSDGLRPFTVP